MTSAPGAKRSSTLLSLGLASLLAARATAQDAPPRAVASLQWVRMPGAEQCADAGQLAGRVEGKLGKPVFGAAGEVENLIEGRVDKTAGGYRAELRMFGEAGALLGSREVVSAAAGCEELSETVAVVLAVMIAPEAALAAPPTPVAAEPEPSPPAPAAPPECPAPIVPPVPPPCPKVATPPPSSGRTHVSAFARVGLGHLPEALWGAGLAVERRFRRFGGARWEGVAFAQRELELAGSADAGARVRLLYAAGQVCPLWSELGRVRLSGCAGLALGAFQSRGFGLEGSVEDGVRPLVNGTGSARATLRLFRSLFLQAGATLAVPFTRTLYEARTPDGSAVELFEQGALAGEFDLAIGASL